MNDKIKSPFTLNVNQQYELNIAELSSQFGWEVEEFVKTFVKPELVNQGADALIKILKNLKESEQQD